MSRKFFVKDCFHSPEDKIKNEYLKIMIKIIQKELEKSEVKEAAKQD